MQALSPLLQQQLTLGNAQSPVSANVNQAARSYYLNYLKTIHLFLIQWAGNAGKMMG